MEALQELGALLVIGGLVSVALAVLLSLSSGRSLGGGFLPAEISDVAHASWLGSSIGDAEYDDRFGFLVSLADGLGARLLLRAPRGGKIAWLYDERMDWSRIRTYRLEPTLRAADLDTLEAPRATTQPILEILEEALREKGLQLESGDACDVLASCGVCRARFPRDLALFVVQLLDPRRGGTAWRALARLERDAASGDAGDLELVKENVRLLMENYPPVPARRERRRDADAQRQGEPLRGAS